MNPATILRDQKDLQHRESTSPPAGLHLVADFDPQYWEYPLIQPGLYDGYCNTIHLYFDRGFKRWTWLLRFNIYRPDLSTLVASGIPLWLNGGKGPKPRAGRRSNYFREWIKANGGPPKRSGRLASRIFANRWGKVEVETSTENPVPYSIISEILEWNTGSTSQSVTQSSKAPNKC